MKKPLVAILFLVLMGNMDLSAQKQMQSIIIQTSAQCEMCKETIEKALAYEKGVVSFELNMETKKVSLKYKSKKTSPEKIRKALSEIGYDADDVMANKKAYSKLPNCCKKPWDR